MTPVVAYQGSLVHREGRIPLLGLSVILVLGVLSIRRCDGGRRFGVAAALSASICAFTAQFFRDPGCNTPIEQGIVVSPSHGRIVHIGDEFEDEFLRDRRLRVSIFLSVFNPHITRAPGSGKIVYQRYHPGQYLVALHPKSSSLNERNTVVIGAPDGASILVRQIAGFLARRICSYVSLGSVVSAGEETGFIKFGSRVDLILPHDADVLVTLGQRVSAGETKIARLKLSRA